MAKSVYIETTIPSAYYDDRDNLVSRFQRQQTRVWWQTCRARYELYTSRAVIAELSDERFSRGAECVTLLKGVPALPATDEILGVAEVYVEHMVMPAGRLGDAAHLAFACVHGLDYLLTWNCRHLANPSKMAHIAAINRRLALLTPMILTPSMLVEEADDEIEGWE